MPQTGDCILVSACLLGVNCRYDGRSKAVPEVMTYLQRHHLTPIPVCPEQLGGLPTPRPASQFSSGDGCALLQGRAVLVNTTGEDVSSSFLQGAHQVLAIARLCGCSQALLKERSPSCGVHQVWIDGALQPGQGVTAALLQREGIGIFPETDLTGDANR